MNICHRNEVVDYIEQGCLRIERQSGLPIEFIDEFRIGLHIADIGEVLGTVSAAKPSQCKFARLDLKTCRLRAGGFYLAMTDEVLSWPLNMLASIHTRSTYARIGLEFLGSSNIVVPGYGSRQPAPLALEIRPALDVADLSAEVAYSFLLAYFLDKERASPPASEYASKFPFDVLGR